MKTIKFKVGLAVALSMTLIVMGCATYGQAGGLGAALGAGAGAIIGNQSGHALEGALIGGALGAITGVIAHDLKERRMKTAQETMSEHNYTPEQGRKIILQDVQVTPARTQPGSAVTSSLQYAVLGSGPSGMSLTERCVLSQPPQQWQQELSAKNVTRQDGTWETSQEIQLPKSIPAGTYQISQAVVMDGNTQFEKVSTLEVTPTHVAMLTQ